MQRDANVAYLERRRPRYMLTARIVMDGAIDDVFAFFSRPENLGVITPSKMGFRITEHPDSMTDGALISYRVRIGPLQIRWQTRIEAWRPGEGFVDSQLRGPYHCWWHEHSFKEDGAGRTIMEDRVLYTPPLGIIGRLANSLFIRRELMAIFAHRADAISLRFGRSPAPVSAGEVIAG